MKRVRKVEDLHNHRLIKFTDVLNELVKLNETNVDSNLLEIVASSGESKSRDTTVGGFTQLSSQIRVLKNNEMPEFEFEVSFYLEIC
jgi:hypothetical protein